MKMVSNSAMELLQKGNWIIQEVKRLAPHGSGNNHRDHPDPAAACDTSFRTNAVLDHTNSMVKSKTNQIVPNDWNRPMRRAAYVIAFGAGNCQDLAALAYCYCRDSFSEHANLKFVVNRSFGHAYVIVKLGEDEIVVDPWPLHAQAVMIGDHFCGADYSEVQKQGTGIALALAAGTKASRVQEATSRSSKLYWTPKSSYQCTRQYIHESCSKSGWITYSSADSAD